MSLDVAQILVPATAGLFPGAATSPAGDGVATGDFAAMLESLAGGQGAPMPAQASGSASSVLAGLVSDEGLALAGDLPDVATPVAAPAPRRMDMATPSGEVIPEDTELTAPALDLRPVDGSLVALMPVVPQALGVAASREAMPDTAPGGGDAGFEGSGAPSPSRPSSLPDAAPSVRRSEVTLAALPVTPPTSPTEQQASSSLAPGPTDSGPSTTPQAPEALAKGPPPAAQAFALAAGLVRVTGQVVSAAAGSAQTPEPGAMKEAPEANATVSAAGQETDPFQVPEPVRQGLVPPAGDTPATDEASDILAKPAGGDPQPPPSAGASTSVPAEAPEAPPAPVRATPETLAALSAQMARRLDDGTTRFTLELNPGDLGRVDVRMEIDAAGGIRAAFTFEHAHSASEMSRRSDELQKSLESAGFNLSGGLSFDVAGDRSQGRSQAWAEARDERSRTPAAPEPELAREGSTQIADALSGRRTSARSGVDIRI
ncbi:MAG: flagellar hook-length control protein FliK [Phenylobacterium sp.]